jgi:hypothetical protein
MIVPTRAIAGTGTRISDEDHAHGRQHIIRQRLRGHRARDCQKIGYAVAAHGILWEILE